MPTYYVKNGGSDGAAGTSDGAAWATISKVNGYSFSAGDQVLFAKNSVWLTECLSPSVSGGSGSPIVFDAYGASGYLPVIGGKGPVSGWNTAGNWTDHGSNKWSISISGCMMSDIARIRIWLSGAEAMRSSTNAGVSSSLKFYCDGSSLWVYSVGNPSGVYSVIERGDAYGASFSISSKTYLTFNNIDFRGGAWSEVSLTSSNYIIFDTCNIGLYACASGLDARSSNHCDVIRCTFDTGDRNMDAWEAENSEDAIHLQNGSSGCTNWTIHNNTIKDWGHNCLILWADNPGSPITDINIYDNYITCPDIDYCCPMGIQINPGCGTRIHIYRNHIFNVPNNIQMCSSGEIWFYDNIIDGIWGNTYKANPGGYGINITSYSGHQAVGQKFYNNTIVNCHDGAVLLTCYGTSYNGSPVSNYDNEFVNNIFAFNGANNGGIQIFMNANAPSISGTLVLQNTFKNNLIYSPLTANTIYYGHSPSFPSGTAYTVAMFNAANGIQGDVISGNIAGVPGFVSVSDFHLFSTGSLAYHTGLIGSPLSSADYDNVAWGSPPSIGALEYGGTPLSLIAVSSIAVTGTGSATTITTDHGTLQMLAAILPVDATVQTVTWSVISGTGSGSINSSSGLLTANTNGTVTVRATANDLSGVYGEIVITFSNQTLAPPPIAPPSNALYNWWAATKESSPPLIISDTTNGAFDSYTGTVPRIFAQQFILATDSLISSVLFIEESVTGNPDFDFRLSIYNSSGGLPTTKIYDSVNLVHTIHAGDPSRLLLFYFNNVNLPSGTYCLVLSYENIVLLDSFNITSIALNNSDPYPYGDVSYKEGSGSWQLLSGWDICLTINFAFLLAPAGTHVPSPAEFDTLRNFVGLATPGGRLKEAGLVHWLTPNTGADNSSGFTALGIGWRYNLLGVLGSFMEINERAEFWTTLSGNGMSVVYNSDASYSTSSPNWIGKSVRCLLNDPSSWHEGDTIVDIDGYIYATIKIGTQVWMASNLYVKHFNDGTPIPMGGADPRFYTDIEWAALVTEAMCIYGVNSVATLPPDGGGGGDGGGGDGGGGGVPGGGGTGTVVFSNDSDEINFDEPLNVTFSIGDIREVSFGSNNKSYTLNFPLTKKIKKLLKFINQADVKSEPNARAYLYVRKTLVIAGKVIVLGYSDTAAKVIISADDWMDVLSNTKMSALNLSDSTFVLSIAKVQDSWSASYPAYRYPMINFGCLMSGESGATANWLATDFIPMISIAYLINKILTPYTIVSDWLNSTFVKDLFILANELVNDDSFSSGKGLNVSTSEGSDNIETGSSSSNLMVTLDKDIEFFTVTLDEASAWADDTYLIPAAGTYHFKASVTFSNTAFGNYSLNILDEQVILEIRKNGVAVKTLTSDPYTGTEIINGITYHYDSGYIHCALHGLITLHTTTRCYVHVNSGTETVSIAAASANLVNTSNKYAAIGDSIDLATELPDMTQLDFLAAIRDIFNLRFFMDKPKGTIYIEPWDQLLTSEVIDITEFVDFEDKPAETISQYYSKKINLLWKNDLDDVAFTEFLKLNAEVPGKKEIIMTSQFAIPGLDIREHQFSSVIMEYNQVLGEYTTKVPRIFNSIPVTPYTPYDRKIGFNTRIVHWAGYRAGFSWKFETGTLTSYPKIEPIDWTDIYTDYWQKLFHYVDKGKLYTIKMKIKAGYLTQFMTKVDNVEKEAFRTLYQVEFNGVKQRFFLQKITSDGWIAELELILI